MTEVLLLQVCVPVIGLEREGCHREGREERHRTIEGYSALHTVSIGLTKSQARLDPHQLSCKASREVVKADVTSTQMTISLSSKSRF